MRIGRAIIIPVILTLSVAGSVLAGPEMSVTAVHVPAAHVHQTGRSPLISETFYHNGANGPSANRRLLYATEGFIKGRDDSGGTAASWRGLIGFGEPVGPWDKTESLPDRMVLQARFRVA